MLQRANYKDASPDGLGKTRSRSGVPAERRILNRVNGGLPPRRNEFFNRARTHGTQKNFLCAFASLQLEILVPPRYLRLKFSRNETDGHSNHAPRAANSAD